MNSRNLSGPLAIFLALLALSLSACFSAATTAERLNKARLALAEAKDQQANIYTKDDFELAARHCGRGEQAFWAGYNHKGFDLARMCIADSDVAIWRSKLLLLESKSSRLEEEIGSLKRELAPYFSEEEISRQTVIIKEKLKK